MMDASPPRVSSTRRRPECLHNIMRCGPINYGHRQIVSMREGRELRVFGPFPIMSNMALENFIMSVRPSIRVRSIPPITYAGAYAVLRGPNSTDIQIMPWVAELLRPFNEGPCITR